ncbi:PspC domain-containing protein [Paenibacillus ferrarius]|uniref:PspC domain-containing protein n=1 Tax=Paenibacillus ferrarius TaxID=1469647 RepID=UPI003D2BCEF1
MNKLFRSTADAKVTGLCGGIAEWLGVNATLIRLLVVLAALSSFGTVTILYFVSSMFIPKMPYSHF